VPYATSADIRKQFDERDIAELVSDANTAVALVDLAADPNLTDALTKASGIIEADLLTSGVYTVAQLTALTGNAAALLVEMTCVLAFVRLVRRRGGGLSEAQQALLDETTERLERLRKGVNIFGLDATVAAGTPELKHATPTTVNRARLVRDRTHHFYPQRTYPLN